MTNRSEDRQEARPSGLVVAALIMVLACLVLYGVGGTVEVVKGLLATDTLWGPWAWQTTLTLARNLLVGAFAIWCLLWLKPWRRLKPANEPVSPATRRTNRLSALSGLGGALATMVLMISTRNGRPPFAVITNSPISVRVAVIATVLWLLAHGIAWWWYFSADEHERRANDVGFLAAGGVFMAATPIWWVGSRAGLLPAPDAMVLWLASVLVMTIGWAWYRSR